MFVESPIIPQRPPQARRGRQQGPQLQMRKPRFREGEPLVGGHAAWGDCRQSPAVPLGHSALHSRWVAPPTRERARLRGRAQQGNVL